MSKFYQVDGAVTTDVWLTPPSLILGLGEFDLDPCCPSGLPWQTATRKYSLELGQDGLAEEWHGRVWLNPPYSNWVAFLKKLKAHGNGIALIFARTETKGFFSEVWDGADGILFLKKRVRFVRADGRLGTGTAPSVLIAYGKDNVEALRTCGLPGALVENWTFV